MQKLSIILLMLIASVNLYAAKYKYKFNDTPVSKALAQLVKENPEAKLTFIYNELDTYTTSTVIDTNDLISAVKAIVARKPIMVTEKNGHILVEALQKGKYRFSGKLLNEYQEPVAHATVLLLNPKDSVVITYGISKKDGSFLIPCDRKPVIAKISSTGYDTMVMDFTSTSIGSLRMNTRTIDLDNVTVLADETQLLSDRTVFVPLQRQKNSAMTGIELIDHLAIPQIRVNANGVLETNAGKPVSVFIDYIAASESDLSSMNMQDVKRVEYLELPADPRFQGAKYVVNFIMEKYLYGGYMKFSGDKTLNINYQWIQANARLQYKKMTYDIVGYGEYNLNHHDATEKTEVFRLPQPDGNLKTINRLSNTLASKDKNEIYRTSFKATYNSEKITAQTTISAGINDNPSTNQSGDVIYQLEEFPNSSFSSQSSKNEKFIKFNGSYFFSLPEKITMTFSPAYTLSHTDQKSVYSEQNFQPITNGAKDNTDNLYAFLNFNRNFDKWGSITAYGSGQYDYYRTRYSGSADDYDKSKVYRYKAGVSYSLNTDKFYGDAELGWTWDHSRFNSYSSVTNSPSATVSLSYLINKIHRLQTEFEYSTWAPNASFKSEAVIEANHLMSYTGNSKLVPSPNYYVSLSYSWMPSNRGYLYLYGNIWNLKNRYVYDYQPTAEKMIRYIRQPLGDYHIIRYGLSGRLTLFNRNLIINGTLSDYIARNGRPYGYTISSLLYSLRATYWLKDFYFVGYFSSPAKYSDGFMVGDIYVDKSIYYLMAGWSNKNWNIRLRANNFARWNWISHKQWFTSEYYDQSTIYQDINRHAKFNLSVTYTFNYGKKLRDEDELSTRNASSSGILKQ